MRIYLASRYSRNAEMREYRDQLESIGHIVTARWIDLHLDSVSYLSDANLAVLEKSFTPDELSAIPELCSEYVVADIDDLRRSHCIISFTCGSGGKGGRHVEPGIGIATHKRMIVVGPRENVFHTLPIIEWFSNWQECFQVLQEEIVLISK